MVEGRKPMPKNEQVVHVWRYWSVFRNGRMEENSDRGMTTYYAHLMDDKNTIRTVDEILYYQGMVFVNKMRSFFNILKKASVTPYENDDSTNLLQDYSLIPINSDIDRACRISDERANNLYKNSIISVSDLKNPEKNGVQEEDPDEDDLFSPESDLWKKYEKSLGDFSDEE